VFCSVLNLTVISIFNDATKLHPVEYRVAGQLCVINCNVEVSDHAQSRSIITYEPRQTAGEQGEKKPSIKL